MKMLPLFLLLYSLSFGICPPVAAQNKVEWIKAGTEIHVELDQEVSSEDFSEGQGLKFKITRPVYSTNGVEVIRRNASAIGRVKRIKEYEMEITVDAIQSFGGMDVFVEGGLNKKRSRRQCCVVFDKYTSVPVIIQQDTPVKY